MVAQGTRVMSISPQTTAGTAAATYNWMPKAMEASLEVEPVYDTPRLLAYSHVTQREALPGTIFAVAKYKGFYDKYAGLPLCGLAGQPTSLVWLVGAIDPDLLTVTHVYGLSTCDQLIDGICTLWQVSIDPTSGRIMLECEIMGTPVTPFTAPSPTIGTSQSQRAGQAVVQRNASAIKTLSYVLKLTQPADPLLTTPLTTGSEVFVLPDEMETDGVFGNLQVMWKLLAYSGSSLAAARTATTEAWIATLTRGSFVSTITTSVVQPTKSAPDLSKPRQRQVSDGPVLYDSGIGALASITMTGSDLSYAKS